MAAFVAALIVQASDRTPWLVVRLAGQFGRALTVGVVAILAIAFTNAVGAFAGVVVAPMLTPNARALLLGFALVSAGIPAFLPLKPVKAMGGDRFGLVATTLVVMLAAGMGDRTQFLTAAIAVRGDLPVFAIIGATLGSGAVVVAAATAGEEVLRKIPLAAIRVGAGVVLTIVGVFSALSALRLI